MTLRRSILIAPVALTTLAVSLVAGCGRSAESKALAAPDSAPPIAVKLAAARELRVPRTLTLSGSLIGSEEAQVAAGDTGKVLSTHVERGSVVRKGAVLVKLDARTAGAQAVEAAAQVES